MLSIAHITRGGHLFALQIVTAQCSPVRDGTWSVEQTDDHHADCCHISHKSAILSIYELCPTDGYDALHAPAGLVLLDQSSLITDINR